MSPVVWKIVSYASLALSAALVFAMARLSRRPGLTLNEWPNLRMKYNEQALEACFEKGAPVARTYLLLSLALEMCLCPALAAVAHNTAHIQPVRMAMYVLAVLRSLLGMAESLCLLRLYRRITPGLSRVSGLLACVKWVCFGLWTLGMFVSLLVSGTQL